MHKAWSSIEKLPYCLSRSFSNFKVTRDKKIIDFDPNWVFRDCNSSLISLMARKWWFWNDVQSLMWYRRGALLILNVILQIPRSRGTKIAYFDPNWAFPDYNSSLNWPMALKWRTKLDVVQKRCPIGFRGHPSNFKVTQGEKSKIWIQFE